MSIGTPRDPAVEISLYLNSVEHGFKTYLVRNSTNTIFHLLSRAASKILQAHHQQGGIQ